MGREAGRTAPWVCQVPTLISTAKRFSLSLKADYVVFRDPILMIETQSSPTYTISYRFKHSKPLNGDLKETKVDPQDGRG